MFVLSLMAAIAGSQTESGGQSRPEELAELSIELTHVKATPTSTVDALRLAPEVSVSLFVDSDHEWFDVNMDSAKTADLTIGSKLSSRSAKVYR